MTMPRSEGPQPRGPDASVGRRLQHTLVLQRSDLSGADAEPVVQHLVAMLAQERRRLQPWWLTIDPHRPARHLEVAVRVLHHLHDAALFEAWLILQFQRVEDRAGRDPDAADQLHRLLLRVLAGPGADDRVKLLFVRDTVVAGGKAGVVDQLRAPDQFHQP